MSRIDELVREIAELAPSEQARLLDRLAAITLAKGLRDLSEQYRERLRREGAAEMSVEEIWSDLRRVREEVAARDYPD